MTSTLSQFVVDILSFFCVHFLVSKTEEEIQEILNRKEAQLKEKSLRRKKQEKNVAEKKERQEENKGVFQETFLALLRWV